MNEEYFAQGRIDGCSSWESIPIVGLTFDSLEEYARRYYRYRYRSEENSPSLDLYIAGYADGVKECLHEWVNRLKREE